MEVTTIVLIVLGFMMVTSALILTIIFRMIKEKQGEKRQRQAILAEGIAASAVIESIRMTNSTMDQQPGVVLEVSFVKPDGEPAKAIIDTFIPVIHVPAFQPGETIEIRYLDGDPIQAEAVEAYIP
ncbi:hypothetical protein [Paenibacillus sp. 1P07SE]|uniref:hypothetical protein n=1 Tax=Paenibacillus sp. 1P07SE TaxID=3132209 RepID=UPI0039A69308